MSDLPSTTTWYLFIDKSDFARAVGSSTINQETGEKSVPPLCCVTGNIDLGPSCEPCSGLWTASSLSWPWSRIPSRILSQTITHGWESLCGNLCFQQRSSSTPMEKTNKQKYPTKQNNKRQNEFWSIVEDK